MVPGFRCGSWRFSDGVVGPEIDAVILGEAAGLMGEEVVEKLLQAVETVGFGGAVATLGFNGEGADARD